jgi:hypothetical protein
MEEFNEVEDAVTVMHDTKTHNIIVKLNTCSYNYIGVTVRLGLQRVRMSEGVRVRVRVRIVESCTPRKNQA